MGQLVRISFPVHRVWEVLPVRCLGHWGATIVGNTTGGALDAWVLGGDAASCSSGNTGGGVDYWSLGGAAVVDPLSSARGMILTVLHWRRCVHAHKIAQIRIVCGNSGNSSRIWDCNSHCRIIIRLPIRGTWIVRYVTWVVRMSWSWSCSMVVLAHVLWVIEVGAVHWLSVCVPTWSRHVSFLSWLWADPSQSSKSWTSFGVHFVSNRLAISINGAGVCSRIRIRIQEVIVVSIIVIYNNLMIMVSNVCLAELVQDWSRSFGVNGRYLRHHLAIISMGTLGEFRTLGLFGGADLIWTILVIVVMLPVLASSCFVGIVWPIRVADCAVLHIISYSILLQQYIEEPLAISVTGIKSIPSELSHFTLSHYLNFFQLGWV